MVAGRYFLFLCLEISGMVQKNRIWVVGLGAVTILGLFLLFFWKIGSMRTRFQDVKETERKDTEILGQKAAVKSETPDEKREEICNKTLPEYGDVHNSVEESILYTTRCIIEDGVAAYEGKKISRVYIRGVENEYNKKIFETEEDILYVSIAGEKRNIIRIETSDSYVNNKKVSFFDRRGMVVAMSDSLMQSRQYMQEVVSPDEEHVARMSSPKEGEYYVPAIVNILNKNSGDSKEYDFRKEVDKMNGVYIDSWSPDGRYLYVSGGLYEFLAPAKLWRIDIEKNAIKRYNLKNLLFPVSVYPQYGVAFVTKGSCGDMKSGNSVSSGTAKNLSEEDKTPCPFELYRVDLDTGSMRLFLKEKALDAFRGMVFDGKFLYYEISDGFIDIPNGNAYRNISSIKKVDMKTGMPYMYAKDESHTYTFVSSKNTTLIEINKQMFLVFLTSDKREYFGDVSTNVALVDEVGKEYITYVEGLVK